MITIILNSFKAREKKRLFNFKQEYKNWHVDTLQNNCRNWPKHEAYNTCCKFKRYIYLEAFLVIQAFGMIKKTRKLINYQTFSWLMFL